MGLSQEYEGLTLIRFLVYTPSWDYDTTSSLGRNCTMSVNTSW